MAFQIGVSGHRHLGRADIHGIGVEAARLFRAIRDKAIALHAADQAQARPLYQPAPPRLRCVCGLAEGSDFVLAEAALAEGWELVAVLPFDPVEFARDFAGAALDQYRSLLARASTVCALDGQRDDEAVYGDVGQIVTEQSDLLLVVWDGKPPRGPGGTGEVAQGALRRGLPLAILPPTGPPAITWRNAGEGDGEAILRAALFPPSADLGVVQSYFAETPRGAKWATAAQQIYERLVTIGFRPPAAPPVAPAPEPTAAAALDQPFLAADRLATEHAARYRAAGLMRYGLILPATLASLVGWYGHGWLQPAGNLADFAILVFVLRFSANGWWEPSHRRFVAYRALAEYLRNVRTLATLGAVAQAPGAAAHQARSTDWTAWYGRAAVRGQGLAAARFDPESVDAARSFVRTEVFGQIRFLFDRAARFELMARRLRQIGAALSICGIVFSAVRAGLLLAGTRSSALRAFNELALVLPAMAPVFLGLLSFNEYSKLATRYRAVAAELQTQAAALDSVAPRRSAVLSVARRIADVMLAEGADWQLLIKAQTVSAY